MGRVTDRQVQRLRASLGAGKPLRVAAMRTDMDEKTARKYRNLGKLPTEQEVWPRTYRTRPDPFVDVWEEVQEHLQANPGLQAKTLFAWLRRQYPGQFQDGQLRSLQRRIRQWRATSGPPKEVFFAQTHHPGRLCASDFTHMGGLGITLGGQPFDHLLYHLVLTYSNWETASICFSESFESLSEGLQQALWELGGVPERHRSDRMSAAVNNLSDKKEFTRRYEALMGHYGLTIEKINARQAHENGDVEQSHRRFKQAVDQALQLRGSRDFPDQAAYAQFLREMLDQQNAGRQARLAKERAVLRSLPLRRLESYKRLRVRVRSGSVIHVARNTYSVHSRLIGERVDVRLYADHLEVWFAARIVERMPRLRGHGKHLINYRHVIENYRYRDALFPTSRFRMAYDALREAAPRRASQEYLEILELAARENESLVDDALRALLEQDEAITAQAVKEWVGRREAVRPITEVHIEAVELSEFDLLLQHKEVWDGVGDGTEAAAGRVPSRAAFAHDS
jgi:hypothetical protein